MLDDKVLAPQRLCRSDKLVERGDAFVFDVLQFRQPARGFALRFEGRVDHPTIGCDVCQ